MSRRVHARVHARSAVGARDALARSADTARPAAARGAWALALALATVAGLGCGEPPASGPPLVARLSFCAPSFDGATTWSAGYAGEGYANDPAKRLVRVSFGLAAQGSSIGEAIASTERVELCAKAAELDSAVCVPAWDFDPSAAGIEVAASEADLGPGHLVDHRVPIDWATIGEDQGLVLRVVAAGDDPSPIVPPGEWSGLVDTNGACRLPTVRAESSRFRVVGVDAQSDAPFAGKDLCTASKVAWIDAGIAPTSAVCLDFPTFDGQAAFALSLTELAEDAQQDRLQQGLPEVIQTWRNGEDGAGGYLPTNVFLGPHPVGA